MSEKGTEEGLNAKEIKNAAEVRTDESATDSAKRMADSTLDSLAKEAKEAESFDHGKNDAGTKTAQKP